MAVKRDKPELLAPAGDMERLKMAVLYGADAVYLAGTSYGMRAFAGNFSDEELPQAVAFAHSHGVRVHCTINTMPRNDEAARLPEDLERLRELFRPVPALQLYDRPGLQPGRLCPALSVPVRPGGGEAAGGVFPGV